MEGPNSPKGTTSASGIQSPGVQNLSRICTEGSKSGGEFVPGGPYLGGFKFARTPLHLDA